MAQRMIAADNTPGLFITPLASLSYRSEDHHGPDAEEFIADRWVGRGNPAAMVSPSYWPFGLGRWACPGRILAVSGKTISEICDLSAIIINICPVKQKSSSLFYFW